MTQKQLKACAAVILAVLILPGCQATSSRPAPTQVVATSPVVALGTLSERPSQRPSQQASGLQKTGCMSFGLTGGDKAGLVVAMVLLAPIFLLGGLLRIFG